MITGRERAWEFFSMITRLSAEKVLTGKAAFGSVYSFHRLCGVFRSAV